MVLMCNSQLYGGGSLPKPFHAPTTWDFQNPERCHFLAYNFYIAVFLKIIVSTLDYGGAVILLHMQTCKSRTDRDN